MPPPPPPKRKSSLKSENKKCVTSSAKNEGNKDAPNIYFGKELDFQNDSTVMKIPYHPERQGPKEAINSCHIPSTITVTPPFNDDESKDNRFNSSFVTIESTADRSEKLKNSIDKTKLVNTKIKNFKSCNEDRVASDADTPDIHIMPGKGI